MAAFRSLCSTALRFGLEVVKVEFELVDAPFDDCPSGSSVAVAAALGSRIVVDAAMGRLLRSIEFKLGKVVVEGSSELLDV